MATGRRAPEPERLILREEGGEGIGVLCLLSCLSTAENIPASNKMDKIKWMIWIFAYMPS